jgi:CRP-like cAMP-binding protein
MQVTDHGSAHKRLPNPMPILSTVANGSLTVTSMRRQFTCQICHSEGVIMQRVSRGLEKITQVKRGYRPLSYALFDCAFVGSTRTACAITRPVYVANNRDDTQHICKAGSVTPQWSASGGSTNLGTHIHIPFMHGDIGQCIGMTRETVTRILGSFQRRRIVHMSGSVLTIRDCSRSSVLPTFERRITCS